MSASAMARHEAESQAQAIPIKKVLITDTSELPVHYSSTPGGTLFSTTPGGTKIVYEKNVLMNLRNSPVSKTPPNYYIPEALVKGSNSSPTKSEHHREFKRSVQETRRMPLKGVVPIVLASKSKVNDTNEDQFEIEL